MLLLKNEMIFITCLKSVQLVTYRWQTNNFFKTTARKKHFLFWPLIFVVGLQPRDKAAILEVNTLDLFLEEFTWN